MKIIIGVTREPGEIGEYLSTHHGENETLTKVGPFLSTMDALNWLTYLKSMIGDVQEIMPTTQKGQDSLWYGFTFEQKINGSTHSLTHYGKQHI